MASRRQLARRPLRGPIKFARADARGEKNVRVSIRRTYRRDTVQSA
jgi:hypothetical protein